MQRLLICSRDFEEIELIKACLERHFNEPIHICMDNQGLKNQLDSKNFSLGVFRALGGDHFTPKLAKKVRTLGFSFPLILLADQMDAQTLKLVHGLTNLHTLKVPYGEKSLLGLTRKLLRARKVPQQTHQRFNTNMIAQIESLSSGVPLLTSMYNLSKGGAYVEFESEESIIVGDLIKFQVDLEDTSTAYNLNGKVVWTTSKGRFSGRFGCGFKFISNHDAYQSLISKL